MRNVQRSYLKVAHAMLIITIGTALAQTDVHKNHDHSTMAKKQIEQDTVKAIKSSMKDMQHKPDTSKMPTVITEKKPDSVTAVSAPRQLKPQQTCPVMGGKIDKNIYVDYKGQRIYVCCNSCKAEVAKDPQKYIDKLAKMGETTEKVQMPGKNTQKTQ